MIDKAQERFVATGKGVVFTPPKKSNTTKVKKQTKTKKVKCK